MNDYLTAAELADLIGCKSNQRAAMADWLEDNRWKYVLARKGPPRVLREYRDRKLGLTNEKKIETRLESTPNLNAFQQTEGTGRSAQAVQARGR